MREINPNEQPDLVPTLNSDVVYLLRSDFKIHLDGITYEVGAGFEYDSMSLPKFIRQTCNLNIDGVHRAAFMLHDYHYKTKQLPREFVDRTLYEMLISLGITRTKSRAIHELARDYGWIFWDKLYDTYGQLHPHTCAKDDLMQFKKYWVETLKHKI